MTLRVAVLLSGGGRTLQNLIDERAAGRLDVDLAGVVGSRAGAYGLERARRADLPARVVPRRRYSAVEPFTDAVFGACRELGAELVCMAGWLKLVRPIPADFRERVLNIHPSLLPAFGGRGYYGDRVHRAALAYGVKVSGCTVHLVDDEYDRGPIVLQRAVPVEEDDDVPDLAARVFAAERGAYPEAIRLFAAGRLRVEGRRVRIAPGG